jgi:hypothetical protein
VWEHAAAGEVLFEVVGRASVLTTKERREREKEREREREREKGN